MWIAKFLLQCSANIEELETAILASEKMENCHKGKFKKKQSKNSLPLRAEHFAQTHFLEFSWHPRSLITHRPVS
jgi:hypothetical protein